MEIKDVDVRKIDLSSYGGNVSSFIDILRRKRFEKITLTHDNEQVVVNGHLPMGRLCFEVGSENVYLKGTELFAKDSQEKLVDLVVQMYHLD